MNACQVIVISCLLILGSGFVVLFRKDSSLLRALSVALHVVAAVVAVLSCFRIIFSSLTSQISFSLPMWGNLTFLVDPLAALFLVPALVVTAVAALYELDYCKNHEAQNSIRIFFGLMCGGLSLVFCCYSGILFLFFWEIMALSAFMLVGVEDKRKEAREASWLYLACTHVSTLTLFVFFALIKNYTGSFDLSVVALHQLTADRALVLFILACIGFGFKAGVFPLHFWLPPAHAAAPSHVSAVLSSVLLKVGIYGIVRTVQILPAPPLGWGITVLLFGAISSLLGVMYAIGQHDIKRLLAYHSIENIGIILLGFGVAMIGITLGSPVLLTLGFVGGMLHVWNHAFFKSLLFFGAGSVVHATHSRNIDRLGGLIKVMPLTAFCFLIGSVAIVGLPPLNGFISELSIYLGLFKLSASVLHVIAVLAVLCILALGITGALALACFVKVFGCVFLGEQRQAAPESTPRSYFFMLVGPLFLVACCLCIGVRPQLILPQLEIISHLWAPSVPAAVGIIGAEFPLGIVSIVAVVICLAFAAIWPVWKRGPERRDVPTWDCGYLFGTSRIQYTATSFAQMLTDSFRPVVQTHNPCVVLTEPFPRSTGFESHVSDIILDRLVKPLVTLIIWGAHKLRILQSGHSQLYVFYILLTLILFLLLS